MASPAPPGDEARESDEDRAARHERERIEANERYERERKESGEKHERERLAERDRNDTERRAND